MRESRTVPNVSADPLVPTSPARALPSASASSAPAQPPASDPIQLELPDRVLGRAGLSLRQRETARAVAEALFTRDDGPPDAARLDWLCGDLDHFFAQAGERAKLGFALCLLGIAILAPLSILKLPPFRALSRAHRAEALERLEKSAFALAVFGAKAVLCILWYEHPASRAQIGHDGACMGRREPLPARLAAPATKLEVIR